MRGATNQMGGGVCGGDLRQALCLYGIQRFGFVPLVARQMDATVVRGEYPFHQLGGGPF